MTGSTIYDGNTKLTAAIAELCSVSPTNLNRISALIKEAKAALSIGGKSKRLPPDVNLAIWQWHYDRLQAVKTISQPENVNIISQPTGNESVETFSHDELPLTVEIYSPVNHPDCVEIITQTEPGNVVEIDSQPSQNEAVELFTQPESVETISHSAQSDTVEIISQRTPSKPVDIISQYDINDLVRIAFYTVNNGVKKRQVIALDGFYVKALMLVAGIDKKGVPAWVQQAVDGWAAFDSQLPITRQVKYLIIQALTAQIPQNRP